METLFLIILALCCIGLLLCFYALYRNERVYRVRKWFIDNHFELYDELPSYSDMMYSLKPLNKEYWINKARGKNV